MTTRRRLVLVPVVLLGLAVLTIAALVVRGGHLAATRYAVPAAGLRARPDSAVVARGHHLSLAMGCRECHGADLGGQVLGDAPPFRLVATNLTRGRGGVGASLTPDVVERALRHGVGHDGRGLWVMPTAGFRHFSAADIEALAAYLATAPAVDRDSGGVVLRPLGRILYAAGQMRPEIFPDPAPGPATTPAGVEMGRYIADIGCRHCHGADLRGGPHPEPGGPAVPSLAAAAGWTLPQFTDAVQTGVRPSGPALDPRWMPWTAFAGLAPDEVAALHAYLRTAFATPRS